MANEVKRIANIMEFVSQKIREYSELDYKLVDIRKSLEEDIEQLTNIKVFANFDHGYLPYFTILEEWGGYKRGDIVPFFELMQEIADYYETINLYEKRNKYDKNNE